MKILLLSEYFPKTAGLDVHGGVEERVYFTAKYLAQNHEVSVVTSRLSNEPVRQTLLKIKIIRVGPQRIYGRKGLLIPRSLFILSAIWRGLFEKFDVVEGTGLVSYFPALILGIFKAKPRVVVIADTVEAYLQDVPQYFKKIILWGEKYILKQKWSKIVCISNDVKQKILKYGILDHDINVNYCGIDREEIDSINIKETTFPTIICVARLVPYKRVRDLVEAIGKMKSFVPKLRCNIVGDGEELVKLKQLAQRSNVAENIHFFGFIKKHKDVIRHIKGSHVFCLPSVVEGFGIATVEALACGIPVILADTSINHEITHNQGVLFFEPKSVNDLVTKLKELLANKTLYERLAHEASVISKNYEWKKHARATEEIYADLCSY